MMKHEYKPRVFDVAHYVLVHNSHYDRTIGLFAPMLQKICYYAQVCNLIYYREPLMDTVFEAWKNGPVSPSLQQALHGTLMVSPSDLEDGYGGVLSERDKGVVDAALRSVGGTPHEVLRRRCRAEWPYLEAWDKGPGTAINHQSIKEYYQPEE